MHEENLILTNNDEKSSETQYKTNKSFELTSKV